MQSIWLGHLGFSSWLRKGKSETQAFCLLCLKSFSVANHRKTSFTLHASGEKHKSRTPSNTQNTLAPFVVASKVEDNETADQLSQRLFYK